VIDALHRGSRDRGVNDAVSQSRAILTRSAESLGLAESTTAVLRSWTNSARSDAEATAAEMVSAARKSNRSAQPTKCYGWPNAGGTADEVFTSMPEDSPAATNGRCPVFASRLREIYDGAIASGVSPDRIKIDVRSLAGWTITPA